MRRWVVVALLVVGCGPAGPHELNVELAEELAGVSLAGVKIVVKPERFLECWGSIAGKCLWGEAGQYYPSTKLPRIVLGCSGKLLAHEAIHHRHALEGTVEPSGREHETWTWEEWDAAGEYEWRVADLCP